MVELLKLEIEGFGKFDKKKTINFKKGINFITGLNETGKSTILEAILASLFKYNTPKIQPYFSWENSDVCKVSLTYKTDKGETFRITSDYKNARKKLEKIIKGKTSEISSTITKIHEYVKKHFGFDEQKVFENTTSIRQSQMAILSDSIAKNKIKDMVAEVLVGTSGASATKALKKINKIVKDSKNEAKVLNEDFLELKEDLEKAEEYKKILSKDSSEFEEVFNKSIEKRKKFKELKSRKEKFDKKEKYQKEYNILNKDIKNIDKILLSINDSIKKRDKLIDKQNNYKGFDLISKEDFSVMKEDIKKLETIKTSLRAYAKTSGKRQVIQEKLDIKYVALFIIGLLFSIVLIGVPLAIYSYKRMKKEVTIEEEDTKSENEICKLNVNKEKLEKEMNQLSKKIKHFDNNTFVELFGEYTGVKNKIEVLTESIGDFIKNLLEHKITKNEDENIRKITKIKIELLNDLTVVKNNQDKYRLVNLTEEDIDELESLKEELEELNNRKIELETSVRTTKKLVKSPEEIKEEVDEIEQKINELNEKAEEYKTASLFLGMAETEVQHKFTPSIEKNSLPLLKESTDGKYSNLQIDEETLDIMIKAPEIKEFIPVEILSQGAKDQVYFTIRTTMSNLLSGDINIPLILDDPFHNFDDIRLKKTISAIKKISENKQIILISHKKYQEDFKDFADNTIEVK